MRRTTQYARETASAEETVRFGRALGERIQNGLCVSLVGPLGVGKTVLAGGICRGLGVAEDVLSPTFVLFEEFGGRVPVIHVDLYRLEHESEVEELGVFDSIGGGEVILVEWGDRSETLFAESDVVIALGYASPTGRRIEVSCTDDAAGIFQDIERW
jgi:tRNA threonylcarbamoyladenosine biosynthesis protein TsaE